MICHYPDFRDGLSLSLGLFDHFAPLYRFYLMPWWIRPSLRVCHCNPLKTYLPPTTFFTHITSSTKEFLVCLFLDMDTLDHAVLIRLMKELITTLARYVVRWTVLHFGLLANFSTLLCHFQNIHIVIKVS